MPHYKAIIGGGWPELSGTRAARAAVNCHESEIFCPRSGSKRVLSAIFRLNLALRTY